MAASRFIAPRSIAALLCFALTAAIGVGLDQWSKVYSFKHLARETYADSNGVVRVASSTYRFIPGWLHFEVTNNYGAVFGMGQGKRTLFVAVSFLALGFLVYLFVVSGKQRFYQVILGMLLAGVVGNLYDRIQYGYVRDMIHALPRWPGLFPYIFNVADSLLCCGVGLMIVHSFFVSSTGKE